MQRVSRRRLLALVPLTALLVGAKTTEADEYIGGAALLVSEAAREGAFLRGRVHERKLCELVRRIAEGRLAAAQAMFVPQEVALAHPHLLLMLEHYERAAAAGVAGDAKRALALLSDADGEAELFRGILRQLGFPLTSEK
jgi:hypothetical protein